MAAQPLKTGTLLATILAIPISVLLFWQIGQPFGQTLLSQQTSLTMLSNIQRQNIAIAAGRLNGSVIEPGGIFSFNRIIGPRTARRGYRAAPSYIADGSPKTIGGGICLLSSAVYDLALKAGFKITERHAHLRPVKSVPPGLDAAVWYGQSDIAFQNDGKQAIKLQASIQDNSLVLKFSARQPVPPHRISTQTEATPMGLYVTVSRSKAGDKPEFIARDHYRR